MPENQINPLNLVFADGEFFVKDANNQNKRLDAAVYALFAIRVILCLMPQNGWITNESGTVWGIVRNVPFIVLGFIIVYLFYKSRKEIRMFGGIWLLTALSFLFYIPVAAAAGLVPALGMLMLPKTVCYMILIWIFLKYSLNEEENKNVNSL